MLRGSDWATPLEALLFQFTLSEIRCVLSITFLKIELDVRSKSISLAEREHADLKSLGERIMVYLRYSPYLRVLLGDSNPRKAQKFDHNSIITMR